MTAVPDTCLPPPPAKILSNKIQENHISAAIAMHAQGKGGPWNLEGKAIRLESGACKSETEKKSTQPPKRRNGGKRCQRGEQLSYMEELETQGPREQRLPGLHSRENG